MMRRLALVAAPLALALPTAIWAQSGDPSAAAPLTERINAAASGLCIDVLSGRAAVDTPEQTEALFIGNGLNFGLPDGAVEALQSENGVALVSRAILGSGEAADGAFLVAIGGQAGQTCRLIITRSAVQNSALVDALLTALGQPNADPNDAWNVLEPSTPNPNYIRRLAVRRFEGQGYIASILAPTAAGPVAAVVIVAPTSNFQREQPAGH